MIKSEQTLWDSRENVELVFCDLSEYTKGLEEKLTLPAAPAAAP